jgi:hypothetical protein
MLLPSLLVLRSVERVSLRESFEGNPTPYGYTISLLLYLLPVALLSTWFLRRFPRGSLRRREVGITLLLLVPLGFMLDLLFGNLFFRFPNPGAILQIYLPGFSFETGGLVWDLPIEEFIFYAAGFCAVLLAYTWCAEDWVPAYGVSDYDDERRHPPYVIQLEWTGVYWGAGLVALALIYKKVLAPVTPDFSYREGWPFYFIFLVLTAIVPSLLLFRTARPFINWRALSMTVLWVMLTSLMWEATLASPYGWWRYDPAMMLGLHVKAWSDLPVEAVMVWAVVSFTTAIVYETVRIIGHLRRDWRTALIAPPAPKPPPVG